MADALKRLEDEMGWTPQETIQKLHEWWKEVNPEEFARYDGDFSKIEDESETEWILSGFESTWRRRGTASGPGDRYVGFVIGYNGQQDLMGRQREKAIEAIQFHGIDSVLKNGIQPYQDDRVVRIGRAGYVEGAWRVFDSTDREIQTDEGEESELPKWAIAVPGQKYFLAIMGGAKGPKTAYSYKKNWLVVANNESDFFSKGPSAPMILECSWDAADLDLRMNEPISFTAEAGTAFYDDSVKILKAGGGLNPTYGIEQFSDEQKFLFEQLTIDQVLAQFANFQPDLSLIQEYHEDNKTTLASGRDVGPIFAMRGVVDYMDYDGKDNIKFGLSAEGGAQHKLAIYSQSLRNENPDASVWISVSRTLIDKHHAFQVKKNGEWYDFVKPTQVFIVVRSRTWQNNDGDTNYDYDALNVVAPYPNRSSIAQTTTEDANDMGSLGNFRGD